MAGKTLARLLLVFFLAGILQAAPADAHWNMEARFWADESHEKFFLRIHNGAHANRTTVEKDLEVCFRIERLKGGLYVAVSEQDCSLVKVKPLEWVTLTFDFNKVAVHEDAKNQDKLKTGSYRAVVVAREQKSKLERIFLGAALERLYVKFEIK